MKSSPASSPISLDLANLRMVDGGRRARFPAEARTGRTIRLADRLHRDTPPEALVLGCEDDAHSTLAQPVEKAIATEAPRHSGTVVDRVPPGQKASQEPLATRTHRKRRSTVVDVALTRLSAPDA